MMKGFWLVVLSIFCAGVTFAQINIAHFTKGNRFIKTTTVQSTTSMTAMGQTFEYEINVDMTTSYVVQQASLNHYAIDVTIDSMKSSLSNNGVLLQFDSQHPANDSDAVFAQPLLDIVGITSHFVLDSTGTILYADSSEKQQLAENYMTGVILSGSDLKVGSKFELLQTYPTDSLKMGMIWKDSTVSSQGHRYNEYKVNTISGNNVKLLLTSAVEKSVALQNDSSAAPSLLSGTLTGNTQFDLHTGLISKRQLNIQLGGDMMIKGISFPAKSTISIEESIN